MEKFINLIKDYNLRKKCLCFELREKREHFTFRKRFRIFNVNSFAKDKRSLPGMYTQCLVYVHTVRLHIIRCLEPHCMPRPGEMLK